MSKGGSGEVAETSQQRASAAIADEAWQRWQTKFAPLIDKTKAFYENDQPRKDVAMARAGNTVTQAFAKAAPKAVANLTAAGAAPGSGKWTGATSGIATDRAVSTGLNTVGAELASDNRKYAGLEGVVALGKGQATDAMAGMQDLADLSAKRAENDAQLAQANRTAEGEAIGTGLGLATANYTNPYDYKKGVG